MDQTVMHSGGDHAEARLKQVIKSLVFLFLLSFGQGERYRETECLSV